MRTKTLSRFLSRSAFGACSAAIVEAALVGCGGLSATDAAGGPDATTVDSAEVPDAASDGAIAQNETSTTSDGGPGVDSAEPWPGECPPPSDPYWNGVFNGSTDAGAACGVTMVSGACGGAKVTGEYVCAAIAHAAVTYNSCPNRLCGACGGASCGISWDPGFRSTDGGVLNVTDDAGNCLIPLDATANVYCAVAGRPSAGLGAIVATGSTHPAEVFARQAVLEAASVDAFLELAENLRRLGAPEELIAECEKAAREEARHATLIGALAQRYGGTFEPPAIASQMPCSLLEIALANATEGLVAETFAAAIATHEALCATDPRAAATLAQIAEEEISHAELSRRIHAWAMPLLDRQSRARVATAMTEAIAALGDELGRGELARCTTSADAADARALGLPTDADERSLHASLVQGLWTEELSQIAA